MAFTVLIDGRSGAGKTTLALMMGEALGCRVVHLDDFYPGWSGLAEGARRVAEDVLHPTRPGFWRWDWKHNRRGAWVALDPQEDVIVEGVGAITEASISAALKRGSVATIRVAAPLQTRRDRALRRDPGYAPYWDMWTAQEEGLPELPVDVTVRL
ncbi:hypothetical protein [Corynebacterium sp. LK2510]|uniref:hypothetical protein n=1 Tax=Corynebacterium sp. LK2510 TaxID=3110472 RepID=UPI0034CEBBA6